MIGERRGRGEREEDFFFFRTTRKTTKFLAIAFDWISEIVFKLYPFFLSTKREREKRKGIWGLRFFLYLNKGIFYRSIDFMHEYGEQQACPFLFIHHGFGDARKGKMG